MAVKLKEPAQLLPVPGIRLSAVSCGLYDTDRLDLALISFSRDAVCSAVLTNNAFCAAPVEVVRQHMQSNIPGFCLINAGNANAGTGDRGYRDALSLCDSLAEAANCSSTSILPFSTGVIGEYLPVRRIEEKIPDLYSRLSDDSWLECARAMMTTDTIPKGVSRQLFLNDEPVTITGIAKGSGMIRPDMATMLSFLATDASIDKSIINEILINTVNQSFNRICVDGDTSTNDACVLIASGESKSDRIDQLEGRESLKFQEALLAVCIELAQAIVRDGEGASKFITIEVESGRTSQECLGVAYSIATSPLVKTAFFASDPNWGRILAAAGRSGLSELDVSKISVYLDDIRVVDKGVRDPAYTEAAGQKVMDQEDIVVRINLARGDAKETIWTSDLSHEYVRINAEYRS